MGASIAMVFVAGILIGGSYTFVKSRKFVLAVILGVAAAAALAGAVLWAPL